MKKKLALLIVTCSIAVNILPTVTGPSPVKEDTPPPIYRTNDHGLGT
ncbi:hypothetical protein SAMN05720606_1108 [Paenibacillus polysaccharolyticus]|jgi:hypothetical protein|uniref:Phr family secreted Rap phosphatase inhibitor n=1 Tax=Paenibacillus polysaccharolyticus TaxID=582692 RepID=A0A1G5J2V2_9BACL|nr:hypothetical protein [Paenibacillus intestini]SCY82514.1 hypothetical protein SAMN05720606_1108 [Paenibacillus polysaccharolyticus]